MTAPCLKTEEWIPGEGACRLFLRNRIVPEAMSSVLIVHGLGEHGGRYEPIADALTSQGFSVFMADLRGHGKSTGTRGYAASWEFFLKDIERCLRHIKKKSGGNIFLFGHSLGGLIAITAAQRFANEIRALILSSPFLGLTRPLAKSVRGLVIFLHKVAPRFPLANGVNPNNLSDIEAEVAAYRTDPLVHRQITPRLFLEITRVTRQTEHEAKHFSLPLLILTATHDPLSSPKHVRAWYEAAASRNKTHKIYESSAHELLNSSQRQRVHRDILTWLSVNSA